MQSPFWRLTALLIIIVFVFFLIIPIAKIMKGSFQTEEAGPFTLKNYKDFASYRSYWRSFFNSVFIGLASAITTILVGVPLAFIVSRWNVMGKALIITLSTLPLMLPSFISAFVWIILLGRQGMITHFLRSIGIPFESIYGYFGLIFVFTCQLYPYVFLMTISAFSTMDESIEEAAKVLGSSPLRTFITVSFPLVLPSILSGALLVFMSSVENFGVPMIIGEQMPILAVSAYVQFTSEIGQHPGMAHTMGIILILITMTSLVVQRRYLAKRNFIQSARGRPLVKELSTLKKLIASSYCYFIVLFALIPFFVAMVFSFMEMRGPVIYPRFSLASYIYAFGRSARPIFNSYFLATIATLVSLLIGVPAGYILTRHQRTAYSGTLDIVIMLPFVVAGTVLGIALTRDGFGHRPDHRLQQGHFDPDGNLDDPGPLIYDQEDAVRCPLECLHPLPAQSRTRRGKHFPGRLAHENLFQGYDSAHGWWDPCGSHPCLGHHHIGAELDHHPLPTGMVHHDH